MTGSWYLISGIWQPVSSIQHVVSRVLYPASRPWHLARALDLPLPLPFGRADFGVGSLGVRPLAGRLRRGRGSLWLNISGIGKGRFLINSDYLPYWRWNKASLSCAWPADGLFCCRSGPSLRFIRGKEKTAILMAVPGWL